VIGMALSTPDADAYRTVGPSRHKPEEIAGVLEELHRRLPAGSVVVDPDRMVEYQRDHTPVLKAETPSAVVFSEIDGRGAGGGGGRETSAHAS
jgi:hypothetical protein